jgi:NADPH2:quinone reductase
MAPYGRVVTLMGVAPDDADLNAYNYNLTLHNVMMLTPMWKGLTDRLRAQALIVGKALQLVAEGKLRILQAESFALNEAGKAQAFLESGKAAGKVILRIK